MDNYIDYYYGNDLNWWNGSSTVLTLKESGNLGIGSTNPLSKLQIGNPYWGGTVGNIPVVRIFGEAQSKASQTMLRFARTNDIADHFYTGGVDFNVYSYGEPGPEYGFLPKTQMDIALKSSANDVETADVTVMTLRDNGNVGIGTGAAGPQAKLHVAGDVKVTGVIRTVAPAGDLSMGEFADGPQP